MCVSALVPVIGNYTDAIVFVSICFFFLFRLQFTELRTTRLCRMHHFFALIWSITFHVQRIYMYFQLYVTAFTLATCSRLNDKNCVHAVTFFSASIFYAVVCVCVCAELGAFVCLLFCLFLAWFDKWAKYHHWLWIYAMDDQMCAVLHAH